MKSLEDEIGARAGELAPALLGLCGIGGLAAAKMVVEVADVRRFKSKDAFARHNGTAPLPVWSSNHERHRLNRTGNRQLNAAIHRMALTQLRYSASAAACVERRLVAGSTKPDAIRALKRRLSDVVYRAMIADSGGS